MSWTFEKVFNLALSSPKEMAFDGKYVWITGANQVFVINYWDYAANAEDYDKLGFLNVDKLSLNHYDGKLSIVTTISIPEGSHWIVMGGTSMWIANAADFTKITQVDIETKLVVGTFITTPTTMDSNLCFENDKLWMVSTAPLDQVEPDTQNLHIYNTKTGLWATVEIPTRKSLQKTWIAAPHNGYVYVTNFNDVGVSKFSSVTGAWVSHIRVNALPTALAVTTYRNLYVIGKGDLLSEVSTVDDTVTHPFWMLSGANSVACSPDNNYVWVVNTNNRLVRIKKSNNEVYLTLPKLASESDDVIINKTGFTHQSFTDVMFTPTFTYDNWNGSSFDQVTIKPYMFLIGTTGIAAVRMDNPLYLQMNYLDIISQGMISTGPEDYMGEIG